MDKCELRTKLPFITNFLSNKEIHHIACARARFASGAAIMAADRMSELDGLMNSAGLSHYMKTNATNIDMVRKRDGHGTILF